MSFSENSRFFLSTLAAALMVLTWAGIGHADLYVATGVDASGNSVLIDINVTAVSSTELQFAVSNLSSPKADAMSDLKAGTTGSLEFATFTDSNNWTPSFSNNYETVLLVAVLDPAGNNAPGIPIESGQSATFDISGATVGTEVTSVKVSMGSGDNEITANLVPEPSSLVLAASGALGLLGYSLRRRAAK